MPNLDTPAPPTHRTVRVVGRENGGAFDAETGLRAHGGVCWYEGGQEMRAEPGEVVEVPVKIVASLLAEGLVVDPDAPAEAPAPEAPVDADTDPESTDDDAQES